MLRTKKTSKSSQSDPLYTLFEERLYQFKDSDEDRKTFIAQVINDYLSYLRKMNLAIPKVMERDILEELGLMVEQMLLKKTYGFHSIGEFRKSVEDGLKSASKQKNKALKAS